MKTIGEVNVNTRSKINWVTGVGTVVVAAANAAAKVGIVDQSVADTINGFVAAALPPIVFILRTFFTVKEV